MGNRAFHYKQIESHRQRPNSRGSMVLLQGGKAFTVPKAECLWWLEPESKDFTCHVAFGLEPEVSEEWPGES